MDKQKKELFLFFQKRKYQINNNFVAFFKKLHQKEEGNVVDLMAGVLMLVFAFATILVMISYGSLVDKRLSVNTSVKDYLYLAEQQGGLTESDVNSLTTILKKYGCTVEKITINNGENWIAEGNGAQIPYGDEISLQVVVSFENPVFHYFGTNEQEGGGWFEVPGLTPTIRFTKTFSSTSRW